MTETTCCVFCGSNDFDVLFKKRDLRYSLDQKVYKMNKCSNCAGIFLSPRINESEIVKYYPETYYFENLLPSEIMTRELYKNVRKYNYLKEIKPGKLLDVGCRDGSFVRFIELFDWKSEGYEFDNRIKNRFNCKITYGEFLKLKNNKYDVITLWAVLEHLYHPNKYLQQIYEMLDMGGYLIIQVPKFNSLTGRILLHDDVPRHITAYTSTWIKEYIENFGFQQIRINTKCNIFYGSSKGFLVYIVNRLRGKEKGQSLLHIYSNNEENISPSLKKIDLLVSKYFDKILRRLDYWGQMTIIFKKAH